MEWNSMPLLAAVIYLVWGISAVWIGLQVEKRTYSLGWSLVALLCALILPLAAVMGFEQ